jgi:hypothetical protein
VSSPESATFYLVNENSATPGPVIAFSYGANLSGWKPVAGDWDGDGVDTVGVFKPCPAAFYLVNRNSVTPGPVTTFSYEPNLWGWWPIAGDWNGDGRDTVGVYDPRGNRFYLVNENSATPAEVIQFLCSAAVSNAVPIAGDWARPPQSLVAAAPAGGAIATEPLADAQLAAIVDEAIRRWADAGVGATELDRIRALPVSIADLPGLELGWADQGRITIDRDAAGYGWFVDPTPGADEEFFQSPSPPAPLPQAGQGSVDQRIDLLTVVAHEIGHELGLLDYHAATGDRLMSARLSPGARRAPTAAEVDAVLGIGVL